MMSKAALFAAALVLSLPAAGVLPAFAQESTSPSPDLGFSLSVPIIQVQNSSMSADQLRDALAGNFLAHVDELANLSAGRITIPEITIKTDATMRGEHRSSTATYTNLVLTGVKSGIAESASIDKIETATGDGTFTYNRMVQTGLDIPGIFALAGLIPGSSANFRPLTSSFSIDGASFTGPEASCTIGAWTGQGMEARPVTVLLKDVMAASAQLDANKSNPPASALKTVVTYILDILTSFRTHPTEVDGFDCKGSGPEGAGEVAVGKITIGGFEPGIYPSFAIENVKVDGGDKGTVSVAKAELKPIDLNPPINVVRAEIDNLSPGWFDKNGRKLIPSVAGFDLAGIKIDVADPEKPGARIQASLDDLDLTMSDYLNGIPTKVSASTRGLDVPLNAASDDDNVKMLLALGIDRVNLDASFSVVWDKATSTIKLDKVSIAGKDLGSLAVAAVLGNAAEQLFDTDTSVQQAAAMGLTVKSITLDAVDMGLADKAYSLLAQQVGSSDVTAYRSQMAGTAEGAVLQMLGSTDAARQLGTAVGDFVNGKAKALTITIASKDPAGITVPMLMQAGDDPMALASALEITGSNPAQ
jgi:hypothetical protein